MSSNAVAVDPFTAGLDAIGAALDGLTGVADWALPAEHVAVLTLAAQRTTARVEALTLRLLGEADARDVATTLGATSTAAWFGAATRVRPGQATAAVRTARALRSGLPLLGEALGAGEVSADQATVVVRALGELPTDLAPDVVEQAEQVMVEHAHQFDPVVLTRLGRRLLDVVDPDRADQVGQRQLEADEARAARLQHLSLTPDGLGGCHLRGRLTALDTAAVSAVLEPLAAPRPAADDGPDLRPHDRRMAEALGEAMRRLLDTGHVPASGQGHTTVVVHLDLDTLRGPTATPASAAEDHPPTSGRPDGSGHQHRRGGGATLLPDGDPISAARARRMACDAAIIPTVLGTASVPLDLGRTTRLFTGALRTALDLRDRGCTFPGCTRPPRWCDGHHIVSWWNGGPTCLDNGVLLCGHHHRLIHHGDWTVRLGPDRHPEFLPPPWIDPQRLPRRNPRPPTPPPRR